MPDVLYYVLYLLYLCVYCLVACPHTEERQRIKKKKRRANASREKLEIMAAKLPLDLLLLYFILYLLY